MTHLEAIKMAHPEAMKIAQNNIVELNHLFPTQEEADTRIILHAADFCKVASRMIVRADDTDIVVLLLYYSAKMILGT